MKNLLLMLMMTFVNVVSAENLKIIEINHGTIKVNGRNLKKSSVFDSKSKIVWSDNKQIIKVIGMDSHKICIYAAQTFMVGHIISIEDLLFQKQRLSSRNGILVNIYDYYSFFNRNIALLSSFTVETGYTYDDKHFLFLSYKCGNEEINKRLNCHVHTVLFNDSIFYIDNKRYDFPKLTACLYYYNVEDAQTTLLADNLTLHISPRQGIVHFLESISGEDLSFEDLYELTKDFCLIKYPDIFFLSSDIKSFLQEWKRQKIKGTFECQKD